MPRAILIQLFVENREYSSEGCLAVPAPRNANEGKLLWDVVWRELALRVWQMGGVDKTEVSLFWETTPSIDVFEGKERFRLWLNHDYSKVKMEWAESMLRLSSIEMARREGKNGR